jgi:hypothetical protein
MDGLSERDGFDTIIRQSLTEQISTSYSHYAAGGAGTTGTTARTGTTGTA